MSITTIWNILNNNVVGSDVQRGIEIPMIQRDYAQGRKNNRAKEIREVFLENIFSGINGVVKEDKPPLELDFIYGYIEHGVFIPLDGQQRLTTLYLIHWYLAFKEQKLNEYKIALSKFNYQTRQSSEDFLNKLNTGLNLDDYNDVFKNNKTFEEVISNKNWYFVNWKYDLTIQSCITMLDEIHNLLKSYHIELVDLISEEKPCVVFNFLDIRDFGLSDDLYIKMNSRGKPLTKFETLKAELGKFIKLSEFNNSYNYSIKHSNGNKSVDLETYFVTKIDTEWSDYFWNIRNKADNKFDDKSLNLLAFICLTELSRVNTNKFDNYLKLLDTEGLDLSYYKFKSLELLNENSIIFYINVLDLIVSKNETVIEYFNNRKYLNKQSIISASFDKNFKARYEERLLFYSIFKFLCKNQENLIIKELLKWDRLIKNLVTNSNYNNSKDFQNSIIAIDKIIDNYDGDVYNQFLQNEVRGFDTQQVKEEKIKIELINKSAEWKELIETTESHKYLDGQIIFLLVFSGIYDQYEIGQINWDSEISQSFFNVMESYFNKFKLAFSETGLRKFNNELFRRALLTKGDYTLYSTNWSFIIDNHRDISWKRLFKETGNKTSDYYKPKCLTLKALFDDINSEDIEENLKRIIKNSTVDDWSKDFIENPKLLMLSYQKYIKYYDNGDIYILRKSKYNKYADPEVKSILLKDELIKLGYNENDIELGFVDQLNQYGVIRIKNSRPKIVFNYNDNKRYLLKQKGKDDILFSNRKEIINYIKNNF